MPGLIVGLSACISGMDIDSKSARDWKDDIIPGCFFLRFVEKAKIPVYGHVLANCKEPDKRLTRSYSRLHQAEGLGKTHVSEVVALLSKEQFDLARSLGWPTDEQGLRTILLLPSN